MSRGHRFLSLPSVRRLADWCQEPRKARSKQRLLLSFSHVFRGLALGGSWKSFSALLLTIALASTFFTGINVGTDAMARRILDRQLSQVLVDVEVNYDPWPLEPSTDDITRIVDEISRSNIEGLTHFEVITQFYSRTRLPQSNKTTGVWIAGIDRNSLVYGGLKVVNESSALGANQTYVWTGSRNAEDLTIGDRLHFDRFNLTVAGFIDLEEQALEIAKGQLHSEKFNLLIVCWNETLAKVPEVLGFDTRILILLDRGHYVNIWDIEGSILKTREVTDHLWRIMNPDEGYAHGVRNYLQEFLGGYSQFSQFMRLSYIVTSLPVFFVSWYMGSAVSDVSYNLRRRQIGLLLTKGFSRRRLLRMLLAEALLVGLMASMIGLGLSFMLIPYFAQGGESFARMHVMAGDTIALVFVFTVGLSLLAVLRPARRASKLDVVEALQEYRGPEEIQPCKNKWPWIALTLGSYKIAMWIMGVHLMSYITGGWPTTNILLIILLGAWLVFDSTVLNYVGPILFFWGFTRIFIQSSSKFQELVARLVKYTGNLGILSARNVRRNPARTAAIAFLIALISGFAFQMIGSYASEQDYMVRQVKFDVGADVSIGLDSMKKLSSIMDRTISIPGVLAATVEYEYSGDPQTAEHESMPIKAVNPEEWLDVAYHEACSFGDKDVASSFEALKRDNHSIILEYRLAYLLGLNIGDEVAVELYGTRAGSTILKTYDLKVVGFFGPKPPPSVGPPYTWVIYWSYIHEDLYFSMMEETHRRGGILVKAAPSVDDALIAEEIRSLQIEDIVSVQSFTETLNQRLESPTDPLTSQTFFAGVVVSTEMHRLGAAFAVMAASIGTALITLVSLGERGKEVSIMSVRGLSFGQIIKVLLIENLAVVGLAILLGSMVGVVTLQGNISAVNSMPSPDSMWERGYTPVAHRTVFPLDSVLFIAGCCVLILSSTALPIMFTTRRYVSRWERIVREA